jgi:phosphate transport system substrate-binding protein
MKNRTLLTCLALAAASALPLQAQPAKVDSSGLAMQEARAENLKIKGPKTYYAADKFDLGDLPAYQSKEKVTGTIRLWGSNYIVDGKVGEYWEKEFQKFHPGVTFEYHMLTTRAAVPALVFGVADLGIGRRVNTQELQLYQRYKNRDPLEIVVATGSYNVTGWNPGFGIVVHKDNPLTRITFDQLDGVFGAERTGGWIGTDWHPEFARGPEKNIRTWGQLGLKGEWADKEITPYGLNLRYSQATTISEWILAGSDKWNEKIRFYANFVGAEGSSGSNMGFGRLKRGLNDDLAKDRYGIAYVGSPVGANLPPECKLLEVSRTPDGPFYAYTIENLQSRKYPMHDEIYGYVDVDGQGAVDPKVREYLRFIVSREGQQCVQRDGKYLPLTAEAARAQLKKLE